MRLLRYPEGPEAVRGEEACGAVGGGGLGAEHVVDGEAGGDGVVVAGVVGGEESAGKPVGADLIAHLSAEIVVGADAGFGGEHGIVERDLKGRLRGQWEERGEALLEALDTEGAHDVVVPAGLIMSGPGDGEVGEEVGLWAEVAAHAEGERVFVVRVVHGKEVCADAEGAVFGDGFDTPPGSAGTVEAEVGLHVVTGEILTAKAEVESRLRIAVGELHIALVGHHAAPGLTKGAERGAVGVAQAGVGELRIFDRVAYEVEGEGAVAGLPLGTAGEGGDEKACGRVAGG